MTLVRSGMHAMGEGVFEEHVVVSGFVTGKNQTVL